MGIPTDKLLLMVGLDDTRDQAKGRVKEAAGALTGDEKLKARGDVYQLGARTISSTTDTSVPAHA